MRLRTVIWFVLAALLPLSCAREVLETEQVELGIIIRLPELPEVRGSAGEVTAEKAAESTIKNLSIWVFLSDYYDENRPAGYCLGYLTPSQSNDPLNGHENRYYMRIDADIASSHPDVDVYVLANSGSSSMNMPSGGLSANTTRSYLDGLLLSGSYYGINTNGSPTCKAVPNNGFPFSAVSKRMQMKGHYPVMNLDVITLTRVVSKFRFVLSQLADAAGPVMEGITIDELSLDGGQIASSEYIFNDSSLSYKIVRNGIASDYLTPAVKFTPPAFSDVAENTSPQEYAYAPGQTAQAYENLILQGISDGVLTDVGVCYLRESDKALSGRIKYSISGVQHEKAFQMKDVGDFARNHSWIVYVYFLRDEMQFSVNWTDWQPGRDYDWNQ